MPKREALGQLPRGRSAVDWLNGGGGERAAFGRVAQDARCRLCSTLAPLLGPCAFVVLACLCVLCSLPLYAGSFYVEWMRVGMSACVCVANVG